MKALRPIPIVVYLLLAFGILITLMPLQPPNLNIASQDDGGGGQAAAPAYVTTTTVQMSRLTLWHQYWQSSMANMDDSYWDQFLRNIEKGLNDDLPPNWRSWDAADLYTRANDTVGFLDNLGLNIDEFIATRQEMDSIDEPLRDEGAIIQWDDFLAATLFEKLLDEGFGLDCPVILTDLLDWWLGNTTNENGEMVDHQAIGRTLPELYGKLKEVLDALHLAQQAGDTWTQTHPETIQFLENLFEHVKSMLEARGQFPDQ